MTFINAGTIGAVAGKRDELIEILTRHNPALTASGCLTYEVGVNDEHPDMVFVVELWQSEEAHKASLQLPEVTTLIEEARPLLSGQFGGFTFAAVGSPLRQ